MTKCSKIYSQEVDIDPQSRQYLISCFRNHLVIYNEMVEVYRKDKRLSYKELKGYLNDLLSKGVYSPVISSVLHSEIYYMHKKADFKQKKVTDVQYMSTISQGYRRNKTFKYDQDTQTLGFTGCPVNIGLLRPLPPLSDDTSVYMNLSYSGGGGCFELSVFTKPD